MSTTLRITILCDNVVRTRTGMGEHGFSAYIETAAGNYLFDTGNGLSILYNSLLLKKDLPTLKRIFLSHGHNDHTGGLAEVLKLKAEIDIHGHPNIFLERFRLLTGPDGEQKSFIGMPHNRRLLECSGGQFGLEKEFYEPQKGIFLTGEVPRQTSFEKTDRKLVMKIQEAYQPDQVLDDQSLVFDTPRGLVILFGCAHSGVVNVIKYVFKKTGKDGLYGIFGGTHLEFLDDEQLEASICAMKNFSIKCIGVSHCTGMKASTRLAQEFGDRFSYGHVGAVFEI